MEYLATFVRVEKPATLAPWVDEVTRAKVRDAARQVGADRLKPIFLALGEKVPYELIRLVIALMGAWLGSSLVAFHGGPQELAAAAGVLLFPVLPALWELRATQQWRKKLEKRRQLVGTPKRMFSGLRRLSDV